LTLDLKKLANKNSYLKELYKEIANWRPIKAQKSSNSEWGSHIDEHGNAVVTYAKSKNQLSALAHELLHFKIQKDGYKKLKCIVSSLEDKALAKNLMDALDNELQHHKMYSIFSAMGFRSKDFYCDDDINTKEYLENALENNPKNISNLIVYYLTLIAPGGSLKDSDINDLKIRFREKVGEAEGFDTIDMLFKCWESSDSLNHEKIVKDMYLLLQSPTDTWVGYDDGLGFPDSGFFVGSDFTIEEFQARYT